MFRCLCCLVRSQTAVHPRHVSFTGGKIEQPVRSVESMRQLAAQLAEAERIAQEAEATLASRAEGIGRTAPGLENNMLSDMHGRHHNYLRISLTERWVTLFACAHRTVFVPEMATNCIAVLFNMLAARRVKWILRFRYKTAQNQ